MSVNYSLTIWCSDEGYGCTTPLMSSMFSPGVGKSAYKRSTEDMRYITLNLLNSPLIHVWARLNL